MFYLSYLEVIIDLCLYFIGQDVVIWLYLFVRKVGFCSFQLGGYKFSYNLRGFIIKGRREECILKSDQQLLLQMVGGYVQNGQLKIGVYENYV